MHALVVKCRIFSCNTPEVACLLTPKLCTNFCLCARNLLRGTAELMCRGGSQAPESSGLTFGFFWQFGLLYASVGLLLRELCIIQRLLPGVTQGQHHNTASTIPSFPATPAVPAPILLPTGVRQWMNKAQEKNSLLLLSETQS